jgi:hypothetical protein
MDTLRREFLAGERPDHVLVYVAERAVDDADALAAHGEHVGDGVALVLEAERGRAVFERATGIGAMDFAGAAMDLEGDVDSDCTGGECPRAHPDEPEEDHGVRLLFAFAEEQNREVDGLYAEGDVIHAYAACDCGATYSDRWLAGER